MNAAARAYKRLGFDLTTTGGNCTAFQRLDPAIGTYILITVPDDAQAPTEAADPVMVGLYAQNTGECLAHFYAPDCDAVAVKLREGFWYKGDPNE